MDLLLIVIIEVDEALKSKVVDQLAESVSNANAKRLTRAEKVIPALTDEFIRKLFTNHNAWAQSTVGMMTMMMMMMTNHIE